MVEGRYDSEGQKKNQGAFFWMFCFIYSGYFQSKKGQSLKEASGRQFNASHMLLSLPHHHVLDLGPT